MSDIKLGDVTVTRVEETHGPIMPTGAFFPAMPAEAWQQHRDVLVPDHLGTDDMVHVAMQTWLLRSQGRTIPIDTGVGNDKNRPTNDVGLQQPQTRCGLIGRRAGSSWDTVRCPRADLRRR